MSKPAKVDVSRIITEWISVEDIEDHPDNPNEHPEEQVEQLGTSHEEIGQYRTIVVWARPNGKYIRVTGHGYSAGAQGKGETHLRAEILPEDTDPLTIKAILAADNLHGRNSSLNDGILAILLKEQREAGMNLAALGTDDEALRQMLSDLGEEVSGLGDQEGEEGFQGSLPVFKEYDESIADDLDTELCEQCGKLCVKGKGQRKR